MATMLEKTSERSLSLPNERGLRLGMDIMIASLATKEQIWNIIRNEIRSRQCWGGLGSGLSRKTSQASLKAHAADCLTIIDNLCMQA